MPVILLTSEKAPEVRTQGMELGATAFLLKPVSGARLTEVVNQVLPAAR
jgi:CheY-like chemotaxis protein